MITFLKYKFFYRIKRYFLADNEADFECDVQFQSSSEATLFDGCDHGTVAPNDCIRGVHGRDENECVQHC